MNNILSEKLNIKISKAQIELELISNKIVELPEVFYFDEIDSTNQWLLSNLSSIGGKKLLCVAEKQLSGRGRAGREWSSPSGANIYMSFTCVSPVKGKDVSALSLIIGLALVRILNRKGVTGLALKWPNDVILNNKKLAGVLIEARMIAGVLVLVVGVGINVKMPVGFELQAERGWADLVDFDVSLADRNHLIAMLYKECSEMIKVFFERGFSGFRDEWMGCDAFAGQEVVILDHGKRVCSGKEVGVDEQGYLLVQSGSDINRIISGDVSLRAASND